MLLDKASADLEVLEDFQSLVRIVLTHQWQAAKPKGHSKKWDKSWYHIINVFHFSMFFSIPFTNEVVHLDK